MGYACGVQGGGKKNLAEKSSKSYRVRRDSDYNEVDNAGEDRQHLHVRFNAEFLFLAMAGAGAGGGYETSMWIHPAAYTKSNNMELPRIPASDAGVWMWVGQKGAVVGKTTNV